MAHLLYVIVCLLGRGKQCALFRETVFRSASKKSFLYKQQTLSNQQIKKYLSFWTSKLIPKLFFAQYSSLKNIPCYITQILYSHKYVFTERALEDQKMMFLNLYQFKMSTYVTKSYGNLPILQFWQFQDNIDDLFIHLIHMYLCSKSHLLSFLVS